VLILGMFILFLSKSPYLTILIYSVSFSLYLIQKNIIYTISTSTPSNSLVFHYASNVGALSPSSTTSLHISKAETILNKSCGWKALTGTTNFGTIASSSSPEMKLAFDIFVDRICGFVGSYYVSLGGQVDALVFAGGIGEKSAELRKRVVELCGCLGFVLDEGKNREKIGEAVVDVGKEGARHRVLVCQTDEQFEMARGCAADEELFA
jgi:acetate kinase